MEEEGGAMILYRIKKVLIVFIGILVFLRVAPAFATETRSVDIQIDHDLGSAPQGGSVSVKNGEEGGTEITLTSAQTSRMRVSILDERRDEVATLFDGEMRGGVKVLRWDGKDDQKAAVPRGLYTVKVLKNGVDFYGEKFFHEPVEYAR